eukprot:TRINITY_DN35312_c0_g1_i1.p1 TRINITY_DN35312_c0_g1~~TRINITY_DN35312_c0_g1_i1.p1  ORF type:complete len:483 (+),score=57.27 TRINITY_DN35312_c0_g1_i1:124-1572(+)
MMYRSLVLALAIFALVASALWILQMPQLQQYDVTQSDKLVSREGQVPCHGSQKEETDEKQPREPSKEVERLTEKLSHMNQNNRTMSTIIELSKDVERLTEQLSNMKQLSMMSTITDTEIARRFAKLPPAYLPAKTQANLLEKLIPDALNRWTCGIRHNHAEDEELLRKHPAMHSNLDGQQYFNRLKSLMQSFGWQRLEHKVFLEVGFGIGLTAAVLRGLHTTVYATEISPVPWTPMRHGPFFEVLCQQAGIAATEGLFGPRFDLELAGAYGKHCGQGVPGVSELRTTFEQLEGVPDNSVDVSYSLAVLEHISDPGACFKALARVHRPGSLTCHQVDLRDHTNFTKPWEFFLMSDKEFEDKTFKSSFGHPYFGNRVRMSEFVEAARSHGFELVHVTKNHEPATAEGLRYASETSSKLRELDKSTHRYASWPVVDDWRCTSNSMPITGLFICLEFSGGMREGDIKIPCEQDRWSKQGFRFGYEL